MRETELQAFHRLLVRASREGEALAGVSAGAYVSTVQDWTTRVTCDNFAAKICKYVEASTACLTGGRPSALVYIRNVTATRSIFLTLNSGCNTKVPEVIVYFGDEYVEGRFDTRGPNVAHRIRHVVSAGTRNLGKRMTCSVCLEEQYDRMQVAFRCIHELCGQCLSELLRLHGNKSKCPLCRQSLRSKLYLR